MDHNMSLSLKLSRTAMAATLMGTLLAFSGAAPASAAGKVTFSVDAPEVQGSFVQGAFLETFDDHCVNQIAF